MNNWAAQDLAQWHYLDILDFFSGAQQAGTQAQQFCRMNFLAPQDWAQWHNLHILNFSLGLNRQAQQHNLDILGFVTGAQHEGTQAHQFLQMDKWAAKDPAQWHNLDILDFVIVLPNEEMGSLRSGTVAQFRYTGFCHRGSTCGRGA